MGADRTGAVETIQAGIDAARGALGDGRPADARNDYARAAALARESGEPKLQAEALRGLSDLDRRAGRAEMALAAAEQAIALCRADAAAIKEFADGCRLAALALDDLRRPEQAAARRSDADALDRRAGA